MMQDYLARPQAASLDHRAVCRIGQPDIKIRDSLQRLCARGQLVAQGIVEFDRCDAGEYVVSREQDAGARVDETHVGLLMARGVKDFESAFASNRDPISVYDWMSWRNLWGCPLGAGHCLAHLGGFLGRSAVVCSKINLALDQSLYSVRLMVAISCRTNEVPEWATSRAAIPMWSTRRRVPITVAIAETSRPNVARPEATPTIRPRSRRRSR